MDFVNQTLASSSCPNLVGNLKDNAFNDFATVDIFFSERVEVNKKAVKKLASEFEKSANLVHFIIQGWSKFQSFDSETVFLSLTSLLSSKYQDNNEFSQILSTNGRFGECYLQFCSDGI